MVGMCVGAVVLVAGIGGVVGVAVAGVAQEQLVRSKTDNNKRYFLSILFKLLC